MSLISMLSEDERLCYMECVTAQANEREISDGCARAIASYYHDGGTSYSASFATTGAILTDPSSLYRELFGHIDYHRTDEVTQMFMNMMGTYLGKAGRRGPVDGWSRAWVTGQN